MTHRDPAWANYSPAQCNALDALGGECSNYVPQGHALYADFVDEVQSVYLKWCGRDARLAELCAVEWAQVYAALCGMIPLAIHGYNGCAAITKSPLALMSELVDFFRERTARRHFPG